MTHADGQRSYLLFTKWRQERTQRRTGEGRTAFVVHWVLFFISMHKFPNKRKNPKEWRMWTRFVRKHRPNFPPTEFSVICSAHFEPFFYSQRYSFGIPSPLKPRSIYLNPGSVPSVDSVIPQELFKLIPESARRQIKVSRHFNKLR